MTTKIQNPIRVCIVGYGVSGQIFHGPLLKSVSDFEVTHVVSSKPDMARRDFPQAQTLSDLNTALEKEIDLVVITTPNAFHFIQCEAALKSKMHVIVEKPFVVTVDEGSKLIALAKKQNRMLTVFQNRRYDGDFLTVQKLLAQKTLGELLFFESHFDRFRPEVIEEKWREKDTPGAGILYDLGSHLIDQALLLFGEPDEVLGDLAALRPHAVTDDYFHLTLKYKNFRVILHATQVAKTPPPRFTLHGTAGSFIKYGLDAQEEELRKGKIPALNKAWGQEEESHFGILSLAHGKEKIPTERGNYVQFYTQVARALRAGGPPPVSPEEVLKTIALIEYVKNSCLQKK